MARKQDTIVNYVDFCLKQLCEKTGKRSQLGESARKSCIVKLSWIEIRIFPVYVDLSWKLRKKNLQTGSKSEHSNNQYKVSLQYTLYNNVVSNVKPLSGIQHSFSVWGVNGVGRTNV